MSDSQQSSAPSADSTDSAPAAPVPPVADRRPTTRTHHGDDVTDAYEWLRDKDAPEVRAHLEAENAYADARTDHLAGLREQIVSEIKARTQETDLSVPAAEGAWWYYSRTVEGQQYAIRARAPRVEGDDTPPELVAGEPVDGEQVLLDENIAATGHDFFSLGSFDLSGDGTRLAYATDVVGDERYTLKIRDLVTGEDLVDEVPGTFPGATFSPDGQYVFYPTVDDAWRPHRIWRHEVGTPAADDVVVFEEPDDRYWVGVGLSRSRKYLEIELGSKITSESWIVEATNPTGEFRVVWPRREGVEYMIEHAVVPAAGGSRDVLLITHNHGALDFEVVMTDVPAAGEALLPEDATVVVPHDPAVRIEGVDAFASHVVVSYRKDALARVGVVRLDGLAHGAGHDQHWQINEIAFDEPLYTVGLGANPAWEQRHVRIGQTSFITPATVYDYDVATGERTLRKHQPVLGGYNAADYAQSREWATADDGTQIPISLVWRRDAVTLNSSGMQADPAPLMLYGYGSYEISTDPGFSVARLSLLDRGVVFAAAHVRGGGEMGRGWYDNGKTLTKKNSFTDFVTCAQHLVGSGWTTPERTVAYGGSAGGLLMGAVANLAPESFAGIVAAVPFVDPLTSILDPSLPLTVIEWDEWGNPLEDPEVYAYMKGYSPYENVRDDVEYPKILALTSINDTRVLYVEPAKWVARLREVGADVVFKTEMNAGHGGVSGRYERWKEIAFEDAWTLDVLGLAPEPDAHHDADI